MIALALLLVAAIAPLVSHRVTSDLWSPGAIVVSAWSGTLGLLALGLLPYRPLGASTQAAIAATIVLLVAGAIAAAWLMDRRPSPAGGDPVSLSHPALVINAAAVLGLIGVAWYLQAVVSRFGWEIFGQGPELRHKLGTHAIPSHYLSLQLFCVIAPLIAWASILTGTRFRWWQLVLPVAAALGTLVTTDRTQFFTILLSGFFAYCFRRGRAVPLARLALLAVVGPAVLAANFIAIGIWTGRTATTAGVRLELPAAPDGSVRQRALDGIQHGAVIYLYATASYPSLDVLIGEPPSRTWGTHTFHPLVRVLQRAGLVGAEVPSDIPPFVRIERPGAPPLISNSYTFLYYPWEDFGPAGVVAYSVLIGLLSGAAYAWARRRRASPARVLVAAQLSTALALSFFVNKFNNTASWYFLTWTVAPFVLAWGLARIRRPAATGLNPGSSPR